MIYGLQIKYAIDHHKELPEVMGWTGGLTHRQLRTWRFWEEDNWNRPDRTDHYIMLIALRLEEIRKMFAKGGRKPSLQGQKIKFGQSNEPDVPESTRIKKSQSAWFGVLGLGKDGKPKPGKKMRVIKEVPVKDNGKSHSLSDSTSSQDTTKGSNAE